MRDPALTRARRSHPTACRVLAPGSAGHTLAGGSAYQWLVAVPQKTGSWVLPLSGALAHESAWPTNDQADSR